MRQARQIRWHVSTASMCGHTDEKHVSWRESASSQPGHFAFEHAPDRTAVKARFEKRRPPRNCQPLPTLCLGVEVPRSGNLVLANDRCEGSGFRRTFTGAVWWMAFRGWSCKALCRGRACEIPACWVAHRRMCGASHLRRLLDFFRSWPPEEVSESPARALHRFRRVVVNLTY
jgi:hypothetical protein